MSLCQFLPARRTPIGRPSSVALERRRHCHGPEHRRDGGADGAQFRLGGGRRRDRAPMSIEIVPTGAALGAELRGVNLARAIDDETFAAIEWIWHTGARTVLRSPRRRSE
jgi:hypothetical protein